MKIRGAVLSIPRELPYASTGNVQRVATAPPTTPVTNAQAAEKMIMEPRTALEQRRLRAKTPYKPETWRSQLAQAGLADRYPFLADQLECGFTASVRPITTTFTPPNKSSIQSHISEFKLCIQTEFEKGRYIGPFTATEIEAVIGPFQSSPLSIIPKPGKPGKFRLIQNLSFPHVPRNHISSINSSIDSDLFPCTWGTFPAVSLLIW